MRMVRMVSPVLMLPSKFTAPIAPAYQRRDERSLSSTNCIAHNFGAPVTVTAQAWVRNGVERIEARAQHAFDMVDGMEQF
jgi:hypothetical protein